MPIVVATPKLPGQRETTRVGRPAIFFAAIRCQSNHEISHTMAIDLSKPLAWTKATAQQQQMLQALQGNILKGHGRPETVNIFFKLDPAKALASRRALREMANFHITSAHQQLQETAAFQAAGHAGSTFISAYLSFTGYQAIDRQAAAPKGEPTFTKGMKHADSLAAVGDTAVTGWESDFQKQIDGMVLIADMTRNQVRLKRDVIAELLKGCGATIVHEQRGSAIMDKANNGIEHFGYVDGRSQPLLLQEDIDRESANAGISRWDPGFGLGAALVAESASPDGVDFGSYFIFRKLEQNVRGFKRREQELATKLKLKTAESRELAGAFVVGRFEDGTPVTLSDEARGQNPPNDFNYDGDAGSRCPFQAHVRKVNPRGSGPGGAVDERTRIMPRRGIPFEDEMRAMHPSDLEGSNSLTQFDEEVAKHLPTGKVGLLFMAYNASLSRQFVFTQTKWVNAAGFPTGGSGVDPIIGELPSTATQSPPWHEQWDDPASTTHGVDFHGFVKMRGGEYFFAPSLNFFRNL